MTRHRNAITAKLRETAEPVAAAVIAAEKHSTAES